MIFDGAQLLNTSFFTQLKGLALYHPSTSLIVELTKINNLEELTLDNVRDVTRNKLVLLAQKFKYEGSTLIEGKSKSELISHMKYLSDLSFRQKQFATLLG